MKIQTIIKIAVIAVLEMLIWVIVSACPSQDVAEQVLHDELSSKISSGAGENRVLQAIVDNAQIEVNHISWGVRAVNVTCTVSNYDISAAFETIVDNEGEMSFAEFEQQFLNCLSEQSRLEYQEIVALKRAGNAYSVSYTNSQLDHLTGGLFTYMGIGE